MYDISYLWTLEDLADAHLMLNELERAQAQANAQER